MLTILVSAGLTLACARPSPTGVALDRKIREPSGLVASPAHPGVFWTHGDSGAGNWLFAVDRKGTLLARVRVKGATNTDWEDLTFDDQGRLWLGDIGNNDSVRRDLEVHRMPEPDPRSGVTEVRVERSVAFHYPEQERFGDKAANFDAESLLWWQGNLWLLTKHRSNDFTRLYRFPDLSGDEDVALEQVARFDLGAHFHGHHSDYPGMTTGADVAPDGRHWALLTYDAAFVFELPPSGQGSEMFDTLVNQIVFDPKVLEQSEAIAWDGDALIIVNEGRAVFRVEDPLTTTHLP